MNTYDIITQNKSFSGVDMVATVQMTINGIKETYTLGSLQTLSYSIHMQRAPIRAIGDVNAKDYVLGPRTIAGSLIFAVFNKHFAYEIMKNIKKSYGLKTNHAFLADELPPFDVTVSFANEYGAKAKMVIYGIRLVNEGQVMSVNDIYTENTYQFVATDIEYLTDENGYSSYQIIQDKPKIESSSPISNTETIGKEISEKIKNQKDDDEKDIIISLRITNVSAASENKKGVVKIQLVPWQQAGTLIIRGESLSANINIDVSDYKNADIYIELDAGNYTAKFEGETDKIYSHETNFSVGALSVNNELLQAAPIIEYCTDREIVVYSNNKDHNVVLYAKIDGSGVLEWSYANISARRARLKELDPETTYIIYTAGQTTESVRVYATTKEFNYEPYNALIELVLCNQASLKEGTLADYINVINEIKDVGFEEGLSAAQAILEYRERILKAILSLNPSNFPSYGEYEIVYAELYKKYNICYHLIMMNNMIHNDGYYALNQYMPIRPPVPEMADAVNCIFLLDENVKKLEFYRHVGKITQFAADVDKISFYDYGNGKKAFRFLGKQGYYYTVYAFGPRGERSPGLQFYVLTDKERTKAIGDYNAETRAVNTLLLEAERAIGKEIQQLNINEDNYNRLLVEKAKEMEINIFPAPTVIESNVSRITVDVSNNKSIGLFNSEFYAVISDVNEAMYDKVRYKKLITSDTVEFTPAYGGIKADKIYAIWIENAEGKQVSPCITVPVYSAATAELLGEEERITLYRVKKIINQVKQTLGNKINITNDISSAIENLEIDETVTYKNVFDKLTLNMLSYIPKIANVDKVIKAIYESQIDILYHVDTTFFRNITVDNNTISFDAKAHGYILSVYKINHYNVLNTAIKVNASEAKSVTYDKEYRYVVIFATSPDLYTKSGMIFIDTLTDSIKTYKVSIGG